MKKLIFILLVCLAAYFALAGPTNWNISTRPTADWLSGSKSDPAWHWMMDIENMVAAGGAGGLGTGRIFYVDSGLTTAGGGTSWQTAVATIDEAVNLCEDSRGDIIMVAQGHAETFIAQALDVDVIGVTIIGCGRGSLKPTITYNHANAEVAIGADNVTIRNIRFLSSITGVLMGIEVEDGVDYCTISGCDFLVELAGTDEFMEAVNFVNNNTGCTIENCYFNAKAGGAAHAIFMDADTDQLTIRNNDIRGDYSIACIGGDTTASTDILIQGNLLVNGALIGDSGINAVASIVLLDSTGGLVIDNRIVSDVATGLLMRVADDCVFMNNYITDRDGDEYSGVTEDTAASITAFVDGG